MKEDPPGAKAELLLQLSAQVGRIAGSLAELSSGVEPPPRSIYPCSNVNGPDISLEQVTWLIAARSARARYVDSELFADPAWDIMLDLLRAELLGERISVSSACIASGVPPTTGLRWLNMLEQHGLVLRQCDPRDARRSYVILSPGGSMALRRYFLEVVGTLPTGR
jgi:hypothetical protein